MNSVSGFGFETFFFFFLKKFSFQFSFSFTVFYILYFFILNASLIYLFYIIYLATNSLKGYLVLVAELCFLFGFLIPLIISNVQYYISTYSNRAFYSYFNIAIYLNSLVSPIFNFVWTLDKIQFYHWDVKLCKNLESNFLDSFCSGTNMSNYNYGLDLPLSTERIYKCCSPEGKHHIDISEFLLPISHTN